MKPTPQQSTSERLGVINLLLCQASFLQGRHTNRGMRLVLTKEERRGDGKRKENMYNFSENKRKDTPKTKFRGFIKNMAVIGANSADFFYVFYSFSPSFSSPENVDFSILVYFKRKM